MNSISNNKSDKAILAAGTIAGTTALLAIPKYSAIADIVYPAIDIKKLEKVPLKDAFVKSLENKGSTIRNHYKFLSKSPSLRVGIISTALWGLVDLALSLGISYGITKKLLSRKSSKE